MKTFTLSDYGSIASIISFFIAIITFLLLYNIKRRFLFRSTLDENTESLIKLSTNLASSLQAFNQNIEEIQDNLALVNVELRAIQKGANGDLLNEIKKTRNLIFKYNSKIFFWIKKEEETVRLINRSLSVVTAELKHYKKNLILGD